jgi:hypothetical protein
VNTRIAVSLASVAVAVTAAACGSSSTAHSPSPSAAPQSGPLQGGVEYLRISRQLNAQVNPLFDDIARQMSSANPDITAADDDARKIRTAFYNWDLSVRAIKFDRSVVQLVNRELQDDSNDIAAFDAWAQATTADAFNAGRQHEQETGSIASKDSAALEEALDVQTLHPTRHMAPKSLRTVVKPSDKEVFADESGAQFTAKNITEGNGSFVDPVGSYVITIQGTNFGDTEDTVQQLSLSTQRVEVDVSPRGAVEPGVVCLAGGSGNTSGPHYEFGINRSGTFIVQLVMGSNSTVFYTGNTDAISLSTGIYHLEADCVNGYLTFIINNRPVFQTYDNTLTSGNAGIANVSVSSGGGSAAFQNFSLKGN